MWFKRVKNRQKWFWLFYFFVEKLYVTKLKYIYIWLHVLQRFLQPSAVMYNPRRSRCIWSWRKSRFWGFFERKSGWWHDRLKGRKVFLMMRHNQIKLIIYPTQVSDLQLLLESWLLYNHEELTLFETNHDKVTKEA